MKTTLQSGAVEVLEDVNNVVDYIIYKIKSDEKNISLINLKLQKLLYYVQAWHLGIHKKPFFAGEFQAWIHGPVQIDIYNRFKEEKSMYSDVDIEDIANNEIHNSCTNFSFVDFILENYARFTGTQLEQMTHDETPWIEARDNFNPNDRCENIISHQSMTNFYGKKWTKINTRKTV